MKLAVPGTPLTTVYRFDWAIFMFQDGGVEEAIAVHKATFEVGVSDVARQIRSHFKATWAGGK